MVGRLLAALVFRAARLPLLEEGGDGGGIHVAHLLELAGSLAVEKVAVGVEDGEGGDAAFKRDVVLVGEIGVVVVVADVDVDEDEALVKELSVGLLMEVNVEDLAVAAPVAAEVEDDALVFADSGGQGVTNISVGVSVFVVDMAGLELLGEGREDAEGGEESEDGWGGFACHVVGRGLGFPWL
jgi:hypothetical protein